MTRPLPFDRSREPLPPDAELWGDAEPTPEPDETAADADLDASIAALAQRDYHTAPAPPRDAMWAAIQARRAPVAAKHTPAPALAQASAQASVQAPVQLHRSDSRWWKHWRPVAALAATLAMGVAIGRTMNSRPGAADGGSLQAVATASDNGGQTIDAAGSPPSGDLYDALPAMLAQFTGQHLAQTEALLVTASHASSADQGSKTLVATWAQDLLTSTRLLLDNEELRDARTRRLLLDLELTLALILQAQTSGREMELQAVREELTSGDLLLRVRSAASASTLSPDLSSEAFE